METVKSLQWSWYNDKEHLRHLTNKVTSVNPRDPKDGCNVIVFDFLNFERSDAVSGPAAPPETSDKARKRSREEREVSARLEAHPILAPASSPSLALQLSMTGRRNTSHRGPAVSLDDALAFLETEASMTVALTTPTSALPTMAHPRDDTQKSILASYLKRVDWIESQRSLGALHDLTPAEKAQREIEVVLRKRKQFSRDRKANE